MSPDSDTIRSASADAAAAPLDLLLTDAAIGALRRVNPGGSGLRLAAALSGRPRLVAGRGRQLLGELARIAVGTSQVQPSGATAGSPIRGGRAIRCWPGGAEGRHRHRRWQRPGGPAALRRRDGGRAVISSPIRSCSTR